MERTDVMVWMRVEGKRERKAGAGWRQVEKWKQSENGRGGGMEAREIGERKRSRLRGY